MRPQRRRFTPSAALSTVSATLLAAALALTVLLLPGRATADDTPGTGTSSLSGQLPAGMLAALDRDLGLGPAEAVERIAAERAAARPAGKLSAELTGYAGSWLEGDGARLVVATSDAAEAAVIERAGARAAVVEHSLAELEAVLARLDGVPVRYVDVTANRVVLHAVDPAAAERLIEAAGAERSAVVVAAEEQPRLYRDLYGGDPFYTRSARCTIGFTVRQNGRPGFVTAGHCGTAGTPVTVFPTAPLGVFRASVFPGNDMGWVEVGAEWVPRPYVRGPAGTLLPVRGSQPAPVGATVCRTGSTTGWHCGVIMQHNVTVTYAQGTVTGLTRTSLCAEPGDSGGPVLAGDQAQGVISGGSGNCSSGGTTYYQPVNPILARYNLTLMVTG
jgi:streptogrisin C